MRNSSLLFTTGRTTTMGATQTAPWTARFDQHILFVLIVAWGASYTALAMSIMPLLVHVWMRQLDVSESLVGYLASLGALGGALGLIGSGWAVARSSLPRIALLGLAISVSCDLGSIFAWNAPGLAVLRFVGGGGAGLAMGVFVGWFARHRQADRCFGVLGLCQFAQPAAAMALMPWLEAKLGLPAIYLCLAFFGLIGCATAALIGSESPRTDPSETVKTPPPLRFTWRILLVIAAGALYNTFAWGLATYVEIYGISLGYTKEKLDFALSIASLSGIPGTLLMILISDRFGKLKPMFVSLVAFAAGIAILAVRNPTFSLIFLQCIITSVAWSFGYPYLQGIQSELDATGRIAIYGTVAAAAGAVAGPSVFALVIRHGDFQPAFLLALFASLACLIMLLPPARRADQLRLARSLVQA